MIELNLPTYSYQLKRADDGSVMIWDGVRRKYVVLTPEEWVRQHFIAFLTQHKHYPQGRIGNEISVSLNGMQRRCDSIVYDEYARPFMIVEYKAPHVAITQKVFDQIVRYNMVYNVPYLIVSNGMTHYCCQIDYNAKSYRYLPSIPCYNELERVE